MSIAPNLINALLNNDPNQIVVHLSCRKLKDSEVKSLCDALINNTHVHSLLLNWNQITDQGVVYLVALLRKNRYLQRVEIAGNSAISDICIQQLHTEFQARFSNQDGLRRLAMNPHRGARCVEEVDDLMPDEFIRRFYQAQRPVVVRGALKHATATEKWTPEYFRNLFGERKIMLSAWTVNGGANQLQHLHLTVNQIMALFDDPATINSLSRRLYIQKVSLSAFPELRNQLTSPAFADFIPLQQFTPNIWFGQNDTHTPLHFDEFDNLFFQIYGQKSITLFAPEDTPFLFQHQPNKTTGLMHVHRSRIPSTDVCDDFFPTYQQATPYHVHVREADVLFIPKRWWHEVRSLSSTSISVNHWFPVNSVALPEVDRLFSDAWMTFTEDEKKSSIFQALPWLLHYNQPNYVSEKMPFTLLQLAIRFDVSEVAERLIKHPLIDLARSPCYCHPLLLAKVFDRQDILAMLA